MKTKLTVTFLGPPASGKTRFSRILANAAEGYKVTIYEDGRFGDPIECGDRNSPLELVIICLTETPKSNEV